MHNTILSEISTVLDTTKPHYKDWIIQSIKDVAFLKNANVFVAGAGRSGLIAKFFGMRLMHLGLNTYIVGETTTPSIKPNDLLFVLSGSGETPSMFNVAKKAKEAGVNVISIVAGNIEKPFPSISQFSNIIFLGEHIVPSDIMPMGTKYELSCLIYLEGIISSLIKEFNIPEEKMKTRHANLE